MSVTLQNLHSVLASQILLIGTLQTASTDVVAHLILAAATLDVVVVHLAQVAEQVAANLTGILAYGTLDGIEAGEAVLLKAELRLLCNIVLNKIGCTRCHSRILQLADELLFGDVGSTAQTHRVEASLVNIAPHNHQVVALLALHDKLAVAIHHLATGGILHLITKHIACRHTLVLGVDELDVAHTAGYHQKDADDNSAQDKLACMYVVV